MACSGNFQFDFLDNAFTATLRGWSYSIVCVSGGATGWVLTVTPPVGPPVTYLADPASTCTPFFLLFRNVLIDCGVVNISLGTDLTNCLSGSSSSPLADVFYQAALTKLNSSITAIDKNVLAGDLIVVIASTVGVDQAMTATLDGSPMTLDASISLPGGSSSPGRLCVFSLPAGVINNASVTVATPAALTIQIHSLRGLASLLADVTATHAGGGTPTTSSTGTTATANEIAVAAFLELIPLGPPVVLGTWASGFAFTNVIAQQSSPSVAAAVTNGARILSGTTTVTGDLTGVSPPSYAGAVVVYK